MARNNRWYDLGGLSYEEHALFAGRFYLLFYLWLDKTDFKVGDCLSRRGLALNSNITVPDATAPVTATA